MKYKPLFSLLLAAAVLLCFLRGISQLEENHREEGRQQLEQALRRAAVTCYALEGAYPPDLQYLKDHYGLTWDEKLFYVDYRPVAANIRPR